MMLELELAPVIETKFNRLPWCHWASPSTTRYESVKSTDTDRLMLKAKPVKRFFVAFVTRRFICGSAKERDEMGLFNPIAPEDLEAIRANFRNMNPVANFLQIDNLLYYQCDYKFAPLFTAARNFSGAGQGGNGGELYYGSGRMIASSLEVRNLIGKTSAL